jgi:hypothetical protein
VHEHIFAAIVTLHETKTLHVVEEFNRPISTFASRFALRSTWGRIAITATKAATIIAAWCTVTIKGWTVRTRCALTDGHWLAIDHEISCRYLAATFHELEFKRLAFCKTSKASLLDCADVNENVIGTSVDLNEPKALLTIEKFNNSLAGTDDLRRHWGAAWTTTRGTEATSATATAATIAAAAISTAA